MATNEEAIRRKYEDGGEDSRLETTWFGRMEFYRTRRIANRYIDRSKAVLELGCATGRYGLAIADRCREYRGIDLLPSHIERFQERLRERGLDNVTAEVGDATRLEKVADARYDVVMALGPLYHLPPAERELAVRECRRVCVSGGVILLAYINKAGTYLDGCMGWPGAYPNADANRLVLREGRDDIRPELFFFTMPEEMETMARRCGLEVLENVGLDFLPNLPGIGDLPPERFAAWEGLTEFFSNQSLLHGTEQPRAAGLP